MVRDSSETGGAASVRGSVTRALAILTGFGGTSDDLRLSDIARTAGLSPSTTHRLLTALVDEGFLVQDPASERYRLGPTVLVLGQRAAEQAGFERARPVLAALAERTGESVSLAVPAGRQVVVVMLIPSKHPLRFDHGVGSAIAIHASAMGKALLAFGSDDAVAEVFASGSPERFTERTIVSAKRLGSDLAAIRQRGWAVNDEERYDGVTGVAAPVLGAEGLARAAIGVQGPTARLLAIGVDALGALVRAAADELAGA